MPVNERNFLWYGFLNDHGMNDSIEDFSTAVWTALNAYWNQFLHNLPKIALALFVFSLFLFIAVRVKRGIDRHLSKRAHDQLFTAFVAQLSKYGLIVAGLMITLQILGLSGIAGGLLAGAGVSALIFGFAFKDIGENFLAGIILAFNRPFNLHDTIKINDYLGRVEGLNFRTTHVKTFDEKDVFIPNAIILKEILTNLTRDGRLRLDFVVGIAYEDDVQKAIQLIIKTVSKSDEIIQTSEPFAVVEEFATSTVNLRIFFWTSTDDYRRGVLVTKSSIMANVKSALIANGFTLPAEIHELKVYDKRDYLPVKVEGLNNLTGLASSREEERSRSRR